MNIVIVNDFGHINGGTAQVAITSAIELANRGFEIFFLCAVSPIDVRLQGQKNIHVVCTNQNDILKNPRRISAALQGIWNFNSAKIIRAVLSALEPNETIVHIHGWTKALSHSVISEVNKAGFRLVITLHDYFIACPNGGFFDFQKNALCPLQALSPRCIVTNCDSRNYAHKLWRVIRGYVQKIIINHPSVNQYIVISDTSTKILFPYLSENANVYLLPNPIESNKFDRVPVEQNEKFYAIGRLSPEKGFDLVSRAGKELGIKIVFIGDGPKQKELFRINPDAQFLGWLPRNTLNRELSSARALVFCSKSYETQGLVISEVASLGIPSIVSDITAGKESIIENQTGLLFKSNSIEDLKQKMTTIMKDDQLARYLSEKAYEKFWQDPPIIGKYTDGLISIYHKILN